MSEKNNNLVRMSRIIRGRLVKANLLARASRNVLFSNEKWVTVFGQMNLSLEFLQNKQNS